jgi:hypothetical protein
MNNALIVISILTLAGCASTGSQYLKSISLEIPPSLYKEKVEQNEKGKATTEEGPFSDDFPPSRTISFQDKRPYGIFASGKPVYAFPAYNVVRLYDLKGISQDRTISRYVRDLKKALLERRNARELEQPYTSLPDFPPRNAGHLVQDKVQHVDFPWGQGVFYLCAFTQGPGSFPNNDELIYLFQGLSSDGRLYVSADFRVVSDLVRHTPAPSADDANRDVDDAAGDLAKKLDKEQDSAFHPDFATIRSWMQNLKIPES